MKRLEQFISNPNGPDSNGFSQYQSSISIDDREPSDKLSEEVMAVPIYETLERPFTDSSKTNCMKYSEIWIRSDDITDITSQSQNSDSKDDSKKTNIDPIVNSMMSAFMRGFREEQADSEKESVASQPEVDDFLNMLRGKRSKDSDTTTNDSGNESNIYIEQYKST